ncbi:MAG TPA: subclass B3 metallo-beta-lactamase [Polyangia bacterium]|nr:subclass B3 metallo-beta-lactamase [Polyangia bacterium]
MQRSRLPPIGPGWLVALALAAAAAAGCAAQAGVPRRMRDWNRDYPPFTVIDNIHHVGSNDIAIFLITTPAGHILLDSGFEASVPRLRANVEKLGFRFADIKILLTSHAHIDHVQAHAAVRRVTGAEVVVARADAPVIESGGRGEPVFDGVYSWPPCTVDRVIDDGATVTLGGTTLTARVTPGHTRGATTWTTVVRAGGRMLNVVFFPSANVNEGVRLIGNPRYPEIADDFRRSYGIWKALPCDVFLADHGHFFAMEDKADALRAHPAAANPFIDPDGYRAFIAQAEQRFDRQLAHER